MVNDVDNLPAEMQQRFHALPKVVQDAILSVEVEAKLRSIAQEHKLHIDQGEKLENEVMLVLLGIQPVDGLQKNIQENVVLNPESSAILAAAVSKSIFAPIRQELERQLDHPEAKAEKLSGEEAARRQILSVGEEHAATSAPSIAPATPPPPPNAQKAVRSMPVSGAYKPGVPSLERKDVHDDPYREPPA